MSLNYSIITVYIFTALFSIYGLSCENVIADRYVNTGNEYFNGYSELLKTQIDKEVVINTVKFLRNAWIECMLNGNGTRTRRHLSRSRLEHQLDMEMLHNTKDFMTEKLLLCRLQQNNRNTGGHNHDLKKKHKSDIKWQDNNGIHKHHTGLDDMSSHRWGQHDHHTRRQHGRQTTITNMIKVQGFYQFNVDHRTVTCQLLSLKSDNQTIVCRHLWVDKKFRMPNFHLCPEQYNADDWTSSKDVTPRTQQVLDLKSFCDVLGRKLNIWAVVLDVKVVWNCDVSKRRPSFLKYKWAGYVDDNGFLEDLQCSYSAPIQNKDLERLYVVE